MLLLCAQPLSRSTLHKGGFLVNACKLNLLLFSLAIGISIGIKLYTLLVLPPIALIALYSVIQREVPLKYLIRNVSILTISTLIAVAIFSLPAGYLENYEKFNNPIGPTYVRKIHSFENESAGFILLNGTKNALRYGFDFLSLDGLPPNRIVNTAQKLMRITPKIIVTGLGIDLNFYDAEKMYSQFFYNKISMPHTDHSYWGILGFGLVMITVGLSAIGIIKSGPLRLLSISSLFFSLFNHLWVLMIRGGADLSSFALFYLFQLLSFV